MSVANPPARLPTGFLTPAPPRPMTEADYLRLDTPRLVEYLDGLAEELPVATDPHQAKSGLLFLRLSVFVLPRELGTVRIAPLPVRVDGPRYREPDVMFMSAANDGRRHEQYWVGADLVMEVASDDRRRDLVDKRLDYAAAAVPEYWVVDPLYGRVTVLTLVGGAYVEAGVYQSGETAASVLLPGFAVAVDDVLNAR